jgi:hypothetical protein
MDQRAVEALATSVRVALQPGPARPNTSTASMTTVIHGLISR